MGQPRPTSRRRLPVKLASMFGTSCRQAMSASTANSGRVWSQAKRARARPWLMKNCAASAPQAITKAEKRTDGKVQSAEAAPAAPPEAAASGGAAGAASALWTFPSVLFSAFVIAWGAEAAQFFMSQGLALALLAWLQTLPEFAVEADIAWRQDVPNMLANFTGSLRLLVGLGWPMIFFVASFAHRRKTGSWLQEIRLDPEHAIQVVGLLVPILYFFFIWWKASLNVWDGVFLAFVYLAYLWVLNRMPPRGEEEASELDWVPRKVMGLGPGLRGAAIGGLFLGGGLILYFVTHPFVDSLKAIALAAGIR